MNMNYYNQLGVRKTLILTRIPLKYSIVHLFSDSFVIFFPPDVNECDYTPKVCPDERRCVNTVGSYQCACVEGWEGEQCNFGMFMFICR